MNPYLKFYELMESVNTLKSRMFSLYGEECLKKLSKDFNMNSYTMKNRKWIENKYDEFNIGEIFAMNYYVDKVVDGYSLFDYSLFAYPFVFAIMNYCLKGEDDIDKIVVFADENNTELICDGLSILVEDILYSMCDYFTDFVEYKGSFIENESTASHVLDMMKSKNLHGISRKIFYKLIYSDSLEHSIWFIIILIENRYGQDRMCNNSGLYKLIMDEDIVKDKIAIIKKELHNENVSRLYHDRLLQGLSKKFKDLKFE